MKCRKVKELLSDYLDRELPVNVSEEVEEHLDICPDCQKEYEEMRKIDAAVRKLSVPEPPEGYWDKYTEEFKKRLKKREISKLDFARRRRKARLAERIVRNRARVVSAAALIIITGLIVAVMIMQVEHTPSKQPVPENNQVVKKEGTEKDKEFNTGNMAKKTVEVGITNDPMIKVKKFSEVMESQVQKALAFAVEGKTNHLEKILSSYEKLGRKGVAAYMRIAEEKGINTGVVRSDVQKMAKRHEDMFRKLMVQAPESKRSIQEAIAVCRIF